MTQHSAPDVSQLHGRSTGSRYITCCVVRSWMAGRTRSYPHIPQHMRMHTAFPAEPCWARRDLAPASTARSVRLTIDVGPPVGDLGSLEVDTWRSTCIKKKEKLTDCATHRVKKTDVGFAFDSQRSSLPGCPPPSPRMHRRSGREPFPSNPTPRQT